MTLGEALQQTIHKFRLHHIEDAPIEARVLLGHIVQLPTAQLFTQTDRALTVAEMHTLKNLIERRLLNEPVAYIVQHKEFFGLDFYVDRRVLIPRPETESLVEEAIRFARNRNISTTPLERSLLIADIGTGSGAIAVSLAINLSESKIFATDISSDALEVAHINCRRHGIERQITLLQGDLLDPIHEPMDVIVANLPYVSAPEMTALSKEIAHYEPKTALFGGQDGGEHIEKLLVQARRKIRRGGRILLEIGHDQCTAVASLIARHLPESRVEFIKDLGGIDRVSRIDVP